jgi:hypothetical protein
VCTFAAISTGILWPRCGRAVASQIEEWDSGRVEPADQQDRLDEDAKRRRRMAERLATELAHAPGGRHDINPNETLVRAMVRPVGRVGLEPTTDGL